MKGKNVTPATAEEISALRRFVDANGIVVAVEKSGLGKVTLYRVLAGEPVSIGTKAAIREVAKP